MDLTELSPDIHICLAKTIIKINSDVSLLKIVSRFFSIIKLISLEFLFYGTQATFLTKRSYISNQKG